jgi:acetyl esterase/lipase
MRRVEIDLSEDKGTQLVGMIQDNDTELEMVRWKKRPAMLVFPGGGYHFISEREGEPIALRFAAMGYQTFVLHYSLDCAGDDAFQDALHAMQLIRANAEDWHIDPAKVAVSGFSAGGNLAVWLAAGAICAAPEALPNALVLGYPVVTRSTACSGRVFDALNGEIPQENWRKMPPCFLWTTQDDELVDPANLAKFWLKLNEAGVDAEMHIYQNGKHGFATADLATGRPDFQAASWLSLCIHWLNKQFELEETQ